MNRNDDHWLAKPATVKRLWQVFIAVLIITVGLQLIVTVKGYFGVDGWFGFGAVFGFLSCLVMVLVAKALGVVLKRPAQFYMRDSEQGDDDG